MRSSFLLLRWLLLVAVTVVKGHTGHGNHEVRIAEENGKLGKWPTPQIVNPLPGTRFAVGDKFKLVGSATDGAGNELPDSSLTWEIRYRSSKHPEYFHFREPIQGNHIEIDGAPKPEDLKTAKDSYLEILLTATDAAGQWTTTSLALKPKKTKVDFDTVPSGLDLVLDGETFKTPVTIATWENHKFNIRANPQTMDGVSYKFVQWSDGGNRSHKYKVPAAKDAIVADFEATLQAPRIASIEEGTTFAVGDSILLVGSAADNQGDALPLRSLTWEVRLRNEEDEEYRTVLKPTKGNNIELFAPKPADFNEGKTGYLEVLLTATDDSTGHSSTNTIVLEPRRVNLVFETEPSGFYVFVDGHQIKTPEAITTWENHHFEIETPPQKKRGITYVWEKWSDGGAASHEYVAAARRRNKPRIIKAVLVEPAEQPSTTSSTLIGALVGVSMGVICIAVIIMWRKKKGAIVGANSKSTLGKESKKSVDKGMQSTNYFGDSESRQNVDESGNANTSDSIMFPTPINLSRYLLSTNQIKDEEKGKMENDEDATKSLSLSKDTNAGVLTDVALVDDTNETASHNSSQSEF